jgi:predicted metal-binding membrane protein
LALARSSALDASGALAPLAGSAVLVAAGAFQFAPLKRACLTHCRHPLTYLLAKWRNGPVSGVRLGLAHGAFCVGCCWALMATSLAVGMTSLWWMVALAAAVFVEQVVPHGHRIRIPLGIALIACGVLSAQASS